MTVTYPRKFQNRFGAREIMTEVVRDRELHLLTLNRYRFAEQRACKDLTSLMEQFNGRPPELMRDLSRHVADEARHAMWLTDLLVDLGADISTPPGTLYTEEFDRLVDRESYTSNQNLDDGLIATIAAINVTEKRGCEAFGAHIYALKQAPQTDENIRIRETIEKIFPEEAAHVRWGNRWLGQLAAKSPSHRHNVEQAKQRYAAIEEAAYESALDVTLGAELRRVEKLLGIANTLPLWQRPQYLMERLPQTLLAPDLQINRLTLIQHASKRNPQAVVETLLPLFFQGLSTHSRSSERRA
jgi:hypothetical protein